MAEHEQTWVTRPDPGGAVGMAGTLLVRVERNTPGRPEFGRVEEQQHRNLVVNAGQNFLAQYISSWAIGANSQMVAMGVGTSTTAASLNQTTILGEVKRLAFSSTSVGANSWSAVTTFGGGSDGLTNVWISEVAVANTVNSGGGTLLNRIVINSFTLQSSDIAQLQVIVACGSR